MTYNDYWTCYDNCYDGYCETSDYYYGSQDRYDCVTDDIYSNEQIGLIIFLCCIIPGIIIVMTTILCCCCHKKKQQERLQMQRAMALAEKDRKPKTPQTQVNQNVTGVAPQGQLVTLPNGQVGIFIPLTQPQQTQVRQVQAQQQQQAPQFYQPQPIYQQQIYQPQRVVVQQVPQQVQQTIPTYSNFQQQQAPQQQLAHQRVPQYIQMPIMPAMPQ
ncbi:Hypothetical_protein [Hexamita inflata]|uniref:Hypothetical_protein n=1 Tax=Hexamita inflata TaxID=28002 RepID=A0AA86QFQ4_9EUKA|nr:Hypothetical protein HINF_LOCUS45515 [Hexamita inflata]CAI9973424.1 Hypothetical protein HINF_LOCUS61069 [Hexamita inflata]